MKTMMVCVLMLVAGLTLTSADSGLESTTFDTLDRSYYLVVPDSYDDDTGAPLLVALHPVASSGQAFAAITGLASVAQDNGWLAVFPDNLNLQWNEGVGSFSDADDIGFVQQLIAELSETYNTTEVYLIGQGNGGLLAYRLACETPEIFAGVATVGAMMWEQHVDACNAIPATAPTNLLIIRGTDDPFYLRVSRVAEDLNSTSMIFGVDDMLAFWADRNACDAEQAELHTYAQKIECDNATVGYYAVDNGRQSWFRLGDYALNQFGVDATEKILQFFGGDAAWEAEASDYTPKPGRGYTVYLPSSYTPETPMPLVMVLHGRPSNGPGMAYLSDMNSNAEAEGFIAVYPNGIDRQWNYVRNVPIFPQELHDDSQFLADLVDDLDQDLNIDRERVYLTGFSNGGFMTQRAACEAYDTFAAFAAVGSLAFWGMAEICADAPPIPLLMMHGTADVSIPWTGIPQATANGRSIYIGTPMPATLEFWTQHNGCDVAQQTSEAIPQQGNSPDTSVTVFQMTECSDRGDLVFYAIEGGGHNWAGITGRLNERIAGNINTDINAGEEIWAFFSQYTLSGD